MLLAALSQLPQWTWDVHPVMWAPPKGAVVAVLAAIGVISLLLGLKRKITDQTTTGVMFLGIAAAIAAFMGDTLPLRYYSLLFVVVFLGGHALLNWQVKRGGGKPEVASDFIIYGVLGVLVGARLGHVLFYDLDHAIQDPKWVLQIWTGGLASHGAVIGLIIAMYLFTKKRGVPFLEGSDRFAFSATVGATVVRIGNLLNSEIVGRVVPDQSWGMKFPRHDIKGTLEQTAPFTAEQLAKVPFRYPSQLYEIALGTAVFIGLFIADRAMGKEKRPRGALISWFFVLYFGGRLFTERYKEIEALPSDAAISMGQYLSFPGLLLGLFGLYRAFKRKEPAGWVEPGDEREEEDSEEEDSEEEDSEEAPSSAAEKDADQDQDADTDDENDEDDEDDEDDEPDPKGDPDVESEFEDGKLKKRREP
jgi:phosphatidylglycerol---prolipoprotein diacylglyceryl transferase